MEELDPNDFDVLSWLNSISKAPKTPSQSQVFDARTSGKLDANGMPIDPNREYNPLPPATDRVGPPLPYNPFPPAPPVRPASVDRSAGVDPEDYANNLGLEGAEIDTTTPGLVPEGVAEPAPIVPESDKSLGRPLAAPPVDVGVEVVPPPSQGYERPPAGQPEASAPPPRQPSPMAKYRREPNEILREAYKPALEQAMRSRDRDLARQTNLLRALSGGNQEVAGMLTRDPTMTLEGSRNVQAALYDPVHQAADKLMYETADAGNKAQLTQMMMDKDSEFAHSVRFSYINSAAGRKQVAEFRANNPGMTEQEAKYKVYSMYVDMSPVAMKESIALQKAAQDVSEGYSREANNFSQQRLNDINYDKLAIDVENEQLIQNELSKPGTFASQVAWEGLDRMFPGKLDPASKGKISGLVAARIVKWNADLVPVLAMRIANYRKVETDRAIVPGKLQYRSVGKDEQGLDIIPPHDKAKDEVLHRNINNAYYQAAAVKDELDNALAAAGAKTYLSPNAPVIRKSLLQLEATLTSINAQEERKEVTELIGMLKADEQTGAEKTIAVSLLRPGGKFRKVIDKALSVVDRVARDKAKQWERPDMIDNRPEAPPPQGVAIGFDGSQPGIGPVTMTRIYVGPKKKKYIVMKQQVHDKTYYFNNNDEAMLLGPGDKEVPFGK